MSRPLNHLAVLLALGLIAGACGKDEPSTPVKPAAEATAPSKAEPAAGAQPAGGEEAAEPAPKLAQGSPGTDAAKPEPPAPTELQGYPIADFPSLEEAPVIKLLAPGAEPLRAMRYQFDKGSVHQLEMRMSMSMSMEMGERKMPPQTIPTVLMRLDITVTEVTDGVATYGFKVPSAPEVLETEGVPAAVMDAVRASVADMGSFHGTASVDSRGATRSGEFGLEEGASPQLAQLVDSMGQSMRQMSIPLPEEPVGVGARWHALQRLDAAGMTLYQVGSYELKGVDGDTLTIGVGLRQLGPPQQVHPPGMPQGMKSELLHMASEGTGSMTVDLSRVVPTSTINLTSSTRLRAGTEEAMQEMSMGMTMGIDIRPAAAAAP